jgi:hypothetical protein
MARPIGPDERRRLLNGRGIVSVPRTGARGARGDRMNVNPVTWSHGTRSTYNCGCRCDPCRDAEAAYSRQRYARRRKVAA